MHAFLSGSRARVEEIVPELPCAVPKILRQTEFRSELWSRLKLWLSTLPLRNEFVMGVKEPFHKLSSIFLEPWNRCLIFLKVLASQAVGHVRNCQRCPANLNLATKGGTDSWDHCKLAKVSEERNVDLSALVCQGHSQKEVRLSSPCLLLVFSGLLC